jgi:hypothetical protein
MTDLLLQLRLLVFVACGWLAGGAPAWAQDRGEVLYAMHCGTCHRAEMHWRAKRAVTDWPSLQAEVRKWQVVVALAWSEDEVLDVARYLNDSIYHFELTSGLPPELPAFGATSCQRPSSVLARRFHR